jgi:hypothetical protein
MTGPFRLTPDGCRRLTLTCCAMAATKASSAPSGIGKSVLSVQAAIEFAIARTAFGIRPVRPLRSLIVQAEDNQGDMIEMARMVDHLKLTPEQQEQVGGNTWGKVRQRAHRASLHQRPRSILCKAGLQTCYGLAPTAAASALAALSASAPRAASA